MIRNFRRAPAFTALVVLTLALGIGATTAMFSVVDAVLITPIPFPHADRMSEIWLNYEEGASREPAATGSIVRSLSGESELFDAVAGYQFGAGTLTGDGDPEMLSVPVLSPSIFSVFPVAPLAGRLFTREDATSAERVVLISEKIWMRRFGGDAGVIGRVLTIDDAPHRLSASCQRDSHFLKPVPTSGASSTLTMWTAARASRWSSCARPESPWRSSTIASRR